VALTRLDRFPAGCIVSRSAADEFRRRYGSLPMRAQQSDVTSLTEEPVQTPSLASILLASSAPERLHAWYVAALEPTEDTAVDQYRVLKFGPVYVLIDSRDDVGDRNPEPGRIILNFDVADARAVAQRMADLGTSWLAELEDRDGSLFATGVDPDGNYVQIVQLSDEHRAAMAEAAPQAV
jgi:hypothetical protein